MATLADISRNIKKVNFQQIFIEVFSLSNIQSWMLQKQKERLYKLGIDVEGQKLKTNNGNPYAAFTVTVKKKKGQPINRVTLKDSGDIYLSMKIIISLFGFEFDADFHKKDGHIYKNFYESYNSQNEFESKILGITHNELKEIIESKALPEIIKRIDAII